MSFWESYEPSRYRGLSRTRRKVLLVNDNGEGPQLPVKGRQEIGEQIRFPTIDEVTKHGIEYEQKMTVRIVFGNQVVKVIKGYQK